MLPFHLSPHLQNAIQLYNDAVSNNHSVINGFNEPLIQSKQTSGPHFSYSNGYFGNIPKVVSAIQYPLSNPCDSIHLNPKGNELISNDHGTNEPVAHINNHQIVVFTDKELSEVVPKITQHTQTLLERTIQYNHLTHRQQPMNPSNPNKNHLMKIPKRDKFWIYIMSCIIQ